MSFDFNWLLISSEAFAENLTYDNLKALPMAVKRLAKPPIKAPRVVRFFQYMDRNSTGKLALAAKAKPTIKVIRLLVELLGRLKILDGIVKYK